MHHCNRSQLKDEGAAESRFEKEAKREKDKRKVSIVGKGKKGGQIEGE